MQAGNEWLNILPKILPSEEKATIMQSLAVTTQSSYNYMNIKPVVETCMFGACLHSMG